MTWVNAANAANVMDAVDAVVVGAGPNGLVAANALVDAGWDVVVIEANDDVGGAVRSAEVTAPGYLSDLFSAFYPLAAASPIIRDLHLEQHGLVWRRAPHVLAHALDDGSGAVLCERAEDTAAGLDAVAPGTATRGSSSSPDGSGSVTRCSTPCSRRSRR